MLDHLAALISQYQLGVSLTTGELNEIRDYFVSNAPAALPVLVERHKPTRLRFERSEFGIPTLLQNVPRVPEAQPVDLDGDGHLDLLTALYAVFKSGGVCWLEQTADGGFVRHDIYTQNGCSHVPTVDLDGDGRADFIAFFSQEHEEVLAFRNLGEGRFESTLLFRAKYPICGSATMSLTDLDQDSDWCSVTPCLAGSSVGSPCPRQLVDRRPLANVGHTDPRLPEGLRVTED